MTHIEHTERTRTAAVLVGAVAWASLATLLYLSIQDAGGDVGSALAGVVYHLLLRRPLESPSLAVLADVGVHYVTPTLFVAFWWYAVPKGPLGWRDVGWWCTYPAAYFVYVLLRGATSGDYPYPLLDAEALGYVGVFAFGVALLVAFAATSLLFVAAGRLQARRTGEA